MAGRAYGNVVAAGRATVATANGAGLHRGPSNKNLGPSRVPKPHPAPTIRSIASPIKGPDQGAGGR